MASLNCLHCEGRLRIRSSRIIASTSAQLTLQCVNLECSATYGGAMEITHGISPGASPNPDVQLRMVQPRARAIPQPANDDGVFGASAPGVAPPPANDDDGIGEAVATGA